MMKLNDATAWMELCFHMQVGGPAGSMEGGRQAEVARPCL